MTSGTEAFGSNMGKYTNEIVEPYDFTEALALSVRVRFCGATESELTNLERNLGVQLPVEYRDFLTLCRYLKIADGCEIGGFDHDGVYVTECPWVYDKHRTGIQYLVFANYWQFADGDQLMFDLSDSTNPAIAYLHEHGPLFETYAPSFSFALWRLVHEI